jgi:hypothetical protein
MKSRSKKTAAKTVEIHVYLTPELKSRIEEWADKCHRSVNGQVLHYIERGMFADDRVAS